jgi:hypothetical protein
MSDPCNGHVMESLIDGSHIFFYQNTTILYSFEQIAAIEHFFKKSNVVKLK